MIKNGELFIVSNRGGLNHDGDPQPVSSIHEGGIPCLIETITSHNKGQLEDSTFKVSSYNVLIEHQELEAKRIALKRDGKDLGEYTVQSIEKLNLVGRVKITV